MNSPAPWRYVLKSGQIVDANNRQIARAWFTSNRERDRANGELIAKAPSMQEALALCVAAIDNLPADMGLINEALMKARPLLEEP